MACHFSLVTQGISNVPQALPPDSLLLLDDAVPPGDHDPEQVVAELSQAVSQLGCSGVYLDFQRQNIPVLGEIASLAQALSFPVAVSAGYSQENHLPVVLPPAPLDTPLRRILAPWKGREIWIELALDAITLTLTPHGCQEGPCDQVPSQGFSEDKLHCHYTIQTQKDAAIFRLWRTYADLQALMQEAQALGVTHTLGLWQELGKML